MPYINIAKFGRRFKVNPGKTAFESVSNEIFKFREYRAAEPYIINAKRLIIDVGAHIGLFSLYCNALNSKVKIIAVEPENENYKILKENLLVNNISSIKTLKCALSLENGFGNFLVSKDSHNHRLIFSADKSLTENSGKIIKVKTITLENLLEDCSENMIDVLKMDIEGAENHIISAWPKKVFKKISSMIFEYHDFKKNQHRNLEEIMRKNGFSVQTYPSKFDKNMGFILAINKKVRRNIYDK